MALVVNDRVKETSTTTGTGTLTLDGAVTGFETFSSAIGNTNTTYYAIELPNTAEFEVGRGTVSAGQLARTEVISSSNSDNPVNFSAGTKNVFCTLPASKAVIKDASNNVTLPADLTVGTDTFDVDSTNEKVSIGTTSGSYTGLNVFKKSGPGNIYVHLNGNPGTIIGTSLLNEGTTGDFIINTRDNADIRIYTNNTLRSEFKNNGNFYVDTDTLYVDAVNDRVGIGTTSPSATLDVDGSAIFNESGAAVDFRVEGDTNANLFFVDGSADAIGFGYSAPTNFITVVNPSDIPFMIHSTDANNEMVMSDTTGSIKFGTKNSGDFLLLTGGNAGGTGGPSATSYFAGGSTEVLRVTSGGNVGIGTSSPSTLLHLSSSDPQITITDTDGTGSQVIKAVTDDLTLDAVSSINLDADSGVITFKDGGTQFGSITKSGNDLRLVSSLSDGDLVFRGNDGGVGITALTLDMSEAGAATFNDKVILGANKVIEFGDAGENISGDGTDMTISSSSNINLDAAAGITLDAGTSGIKLDDDGTTIGLLYFLSGNLNIKPSQSDTDLVIKGNDGGSEITALTLDMSEAGDATFNSNIYLGDNKKANFGAGNDLQIYHDGSLSYIVDSGTGDLRIESNFLRLVDRDNNSTTATFDSSGVNLRHSDAVKLTTVSTGIDVTGTAVTDGLTVAGDVSVDSGTIKLDGNYPTGTDNVALGDTALDSVTSGGQNTAIGSIALTALTTASFNTAIGYKALEDNISGTKNTAIGSNAASNTTGANNVAIGVRTLFFNTLGGKNTAVGEEALLNGTSASQNTALGYQAGTTVSGGSNLTILGYQAEPSSGTATNEITLGNASVTSLRIPGLTSGASSGDVLTYNGTDIGFSTPSTGIAAVVDDTTPQLGGDLDLNSNNITGTGNINNVGTITTDGLTVDGNVSVDSGTIKLDGNYPTGTNNVAMGDTALDSVTTGSSNTMIGHQSGTDLLGGGNNTGIGNRALANITSANHNTAVGSDALLFATTGGGNTAIGRAAMQTERTGGSNVAVGQSALVTQNGGNNNTGIGYQAGNIITTGSNLTLLGYQAQPSSATATNEITLGNASVTSLRIPGLASGASSGDVLTYDGTDITLSAPTGVSAGFSIAMAIAL